MKVKPILTALRISAVSIIGLSVFELMGYFMLSFSNLLVNNNYISITAFLFNYGLIDLSRSIMWVFIPIGIVLFLVFGVLLTIFTFKSDLYDKVISKYLFLFGMLTLVNSFIVLAYIVFLGKAGTFMVGNEVLTFQQLLYNPIMSTLLIAFMWYFFYIVICCHLVFGLLYSAIGLYWIITIEREEPSGQD